MLIILQTFRVMLKLLLQGKLGMAHLKDRKVNSQPEEKLQSIKTKQLKWVYLDKGGKWMMIYLILKFFYLSVLQDLRVNKEGDLKVRKDQLIGSQIVGKMLKILLLIMMMQFQCHEEDDVNYLILKNKS